MGEHGQFFRNPDLYELERRRPPELSELADHGPEIDAAAGSFQTLAEGVEDTHKKSNPKFETKRKTVQ